MTSLASLKQSAMPWSYSYKPPNSNITYDVSNTCCFDTQLQMVYYIWFRGFLPHLVVNKDPLLLEALNNIRKGNSAKARHDLMIGRSVPVKVEKEGNIERWNCWGQLDETKPYPELFRSPGKMHLIWGHCSKMGENCPLHEFFQKKRTDWKRKTLRFPANRNATIQETLLKCDAPSKPCRRDKDNLCPENGTRQGYPVSSYSSCPWMMTIRGDYPFRTLNDIPKEVIFPPDTQYYLASVILIFNGLHFKGISVDAKNAHGKHLLYDGMNAPEDRIQMIKADDPISKYADKYTISELWYVKVDRSSAEKGSASPSTTLKPVGIPNLANTCYFTTLVQILFWVIPLRKSLIAVELSNRDGKEIQPIISETLEADSDILFDALGFLKELLLTLQTAIVEKKPNMKIIMKNLRDIMKNLVKCLGLDPKENQCINEFWNTLFHNYFEFIGVSHLYRLQVTTFYLEVLDHNKTGTAREKKEALSQNLLSILPVDIQKYV